MSPPILHSPSRPVTIVSRGRDTARVIKRKPWHLLRSVRVSHAAVVISDLLGIAHRIRDSVDHLHAAMAWLCRAQDACTGGGVSAAYSLLRGWEPPYPETTGYIIPTFLDFFEFTSNDEFQQRALRMGEWLLTIQLESGAFQAGYYHGAPDESAPSVFNTGQILLGLTRLYRETLDPRYRTAASRAGNWLVQLQDPDGAWYRGLSFHGPNTAVRAYYVRVAWALMELACIVRDDRFQEAAARSVRWALGQQQENGWFRNNAFRGGSDPFTHTIAYVLEGLLGYAHHTDDQACIQAVLKTATRLLHLFEVRPHFPGEFGPDWKSDAAYRCLTGEAQIGAIWLRLYTLTADARFLNSALKLLDRLKAVQDLTSSNRGVRGGIKGSHPVWGGYHRMSFVSWGEKFFVEALLAEIDIMGRLEEERPPR